MGAAILCVVIVAGCGPAPLGTGWPAISLMTSECGDQISENDKEKHGVHFVINKPFSMLQLENLLTKIQ